MITGSYATGPVTGSPAGGLVGTNGTSLDEATIRATYATGSVSGAIAGGLVGQNAGEGTIAVSYATGRVADGRSHGGLVGDDQRGTVTSSYWDTGTSGHGSGSPGSGRTTSQLQSPTSYSGIYASWNADVDGDGTNDDPWDFGTSSQYPVLRADMDRNDEATWEEFGYQIRSGPTLTASASATTTAGVAQVALSWTAVDATHWDPAPAVAYAVTRTEGATVETLAESTGELTHTDSARTGTTFSYQVAAVVDGGHPVRSAVVGVSTPGNSPPLPVGTLPDRWLHVGDSAAVEVGEAFEDPEDDAADLRRRLVGHRRGHGERVGHAGDDHAGGGRHGDDHGDGDRRGRIDRERDADVHGDRDAVERGRLRRRRRRLDRDHDAGPARCRAPRPGRRRRAHRGRGGGICGGVLHGRPIARPAAG